VPRTGSELDLTAADRGTLVGAVCFFVGALLAIPAWRRAGVTAADSADGEAAGSSSAG